MEFKSTVIHKIYLTSEDVISALREKYAFPSHSDIFFTTPCRSSDDIVTVSWEERADESL